MTLDPTQPQANCPPPARLCAPGVRKWRRDHSSGEFSLSRTKAGVLGLGCAGGSYPAKILLAMPRGPGSTAHVQIEGGQWRVGLASKGEAQLCADI
jgi:hypothetical protein